jgi:mannosyltransferase
MIKKISRDITLLCNTYPNILVILITALGLVLRLGQFGYSYCCDDFRNLDGISGNSITSVIQFITSPNVPYPPFYWLILHYWAKLVGIQNENLIRIPSLFFGFLSVPATYVLGKYILGKKIGFVSMFFVALSPFMVEHASQIKPHTLMVLLAILLTYFAFKWLYSRKIMPYLLCYCLLGIISLYTHYHMFLIILALNIYIFLYLWKVQRTRLWDWIVAQILVGLTFIPWLPFVGRQVTANVSVGNLLSSLPEIFVTFSTGYSAIKFSSISVDKTPSMALIINNLLILFLMLVSFGSAIVIGIYRAIKMGYRGWLILLGLGVPVLLATLFAIKNPGANSPKYLIGASIFFYFLIAIGVEKISSQKLDKILLITVLVFNIYSLSNYYFRETDFGRKMNWREAAQHIMNNSQPDDIIVTAEPESLEWYYHGNLPIAFFFYMPLGNSTESEFQRANEIIGAHKRVWVVESGRESTDPSTPQSVALTWLRSNYSEAEKIQFNPTLILHLFELPVQ